MRSHYDDLFPISHSDGSVTTPPVVSVLGPVSTDVWAGGSSQTITWTAIDSDDGIEPNSVTLEYTDDGGVSWHLIASGEANSGSYAWTAPSVSSAQVQVRVSAENTVGDRVDAVSSSFMIDSSGPTVSLTSPNGGESWDANSTQTITWTASDAHSGLGADPIRLEYSLNGTDWALIADDLAHSGSYSWTVPFLDSWSRHSGATVVGWSAADNLDRSQVRVRVTAVDAVGNSASDASDADWEIAMSAPRIDKVVKSGTRLGYAVYYPEGHEQKNDWPVLIFFHGAGESGNGTSASLDNVITIHGPMKTARGPGANVLTGPKLPFVILAPQHTNWSDARWTDGVMQEWMDYALDSARGYKIDRSRIHGTGLSMGGSAAFNMGYHLSGQAGANGYAYQVATISPISAYNQTIIDYARAEAMVEGGVSAWVFQAVNDGTSNPSSASIPARPFYRYFAQKLGADSTYYSTLTWPGSYDADGNNTSYFDPALGVSGQWKVEMSSDFGTWDGGGVFHPYNDVRYLYTWNDDGGHSGAYWNEIYTRRSYYRWMLQQIRP